MNSIQFESIIEGGMILIPEQYNGKVPSAVKVTLMPITEGGIKLNPNAGAGSLSQKDFSALKIDTRGFSFDREDANERR